MLLPLTHPLSMMSCHVHILFCGGKTVYLSIATHEFSLQCLIKYLSDYLSTHQAAG